MFNDEDKGFEIPPNIIINKPNNPSIADNPTQFSILPNPNKFLPNLQSNYIPLHDNHHPHHDHLPSLNPNPNHAPSSSLSSDQQTLTLAKAHNNGGDQEQEIKRLKRMISNRESARRSRMRKRKQLETLQAQVLQLLSANHQLAEKLNHAMESNYHILQENARLRDESISLRKSLADLLLSMKATDLDETSM